MAERVDFSRVFVAHPEDGHWRVEHGTTFPESASRQIDDELDGITNELDVVRLGIESPFAKGDAVVLVTEEGVLETRVIGLGGWRGGGQDWVAAVLDAKAPAAAAPNDPPSRALAVLGPPPSPDARVQPLPAVPLGARVGLALEEGKAELPKLKAAFLEMMGEEAGPELEDLHVGPGCAKAFAPALAPGFEQLVVVHCGEEDSMDPALSGIVVLGEAPQVLYSWNLDTWGLELVGVVDLDGDDVDELWVRASGHEWWSTSLYRWDGQRYVEQELGSDSL